MGSPVVIASDLFPADLALGLPVAALGLEGIGAVSRDQTIWNELKEDHLILLFCPDSQMNKGCNVRSCFIGTVVRSI
jgi:hypothetical protein